MKQYKKLHLNKLKSNIHKNQQKPKRAIQGFAHKNSHTEIGKFKEEKAKILIRNPK